MTKLIGLFGNPVDHSRSPEIWNRYFKEKSLDYHYQAFNVDTYRLDAAIDSVSALNMTAVNITMPFKDKIIDYLNDYSSIVEKSGSVNLIENKNGELYGYDTDYGFTDDINKVLYQKDFNALIFGCGGIARSSYLSLESLGFDRFYVYDTHSKKFEKFCSDTGALKAYGLNNMDSYKVIINCTPVGMKPGEKLPFDYSLITKNHIVIDYPYCNDGDTELIKAAKAAGATYADGDMLLRAQIKRSMEVIGI